MPKITVIIPTFNREQYVTKAIDSVLNQRFRDYEIVVVDDGSTDNTNEVLKHYGKAIRCIYQANQGASAARNTGIKAARGEWLAFLDSDDEWMSEYLEIQMQYAAENSRICMQSTDAIIHADGTTTRYFELNRSFQMFSGRDYVVLKRPFSFIVQHGVWQLGSTIIRCDATKAAGVFDITVPVCHDFDLMARVGLRGQFGLIRRALVNVHRRTEAIEALTVQAARHPIEARQANERMYENLMNIDGLTAMERNAVRALRSSNQRAIGNFLLARGDGQGAQTYYTAAVSTYPCMKSVGKYVLHLGRHLVRTLGHTAVPR